MLLRPEAGRISSLGNSVLGQRRLSPSILFLPPDVVEEHFAVVEGHSYSDSVVDFAVDSVVEVVDFVVGF